jgi:cell division cycle protein 20 (cofactor of APC complex)
MCVQGHKFIRDQSTMGMDHVHYLLTEIKKDNGKEYATTMEACPSREAYWRLLAEKLLNTPPEPQNVSIVPL